MAWSKDDWQDLNMSLAAQFHRGAFLAIPDAVSGDGGLEGFSKDDLAVGYQCYVPEEVAKRPLEDRIIDKMNKDTLKLKNNAPFFKKCLDTVRLKRWTLLIPREFMQHKSIAEHAGVRAREVRSWSLPFIDGDFSITISCGSEFDAYRQACLQFGRGRIGINLPGPTDEERLEWERINAVRMRVLDDKLNQTHHKPSVIQTVKASLIRDAVKAQNSFARLEKEDPEGWSTLVKVKAEKRDALELESALNTSVPAEYLKTVIASYKARALQEMPALDDQAANILVNEAIVEWLFACPLNFEATAPDGN